MSVKLRDFIRNVRNCRTAAEERSVVAKECALIRNAFKEGDGHYRHRNVAKLLFIHMMGYPTHFGQMECLRLIASSRFAEKRIGYLGLTQFMDEDADILMLVTNSIKKDLQHPSQYVNGLGLTALANIGSSEMCQTLAREVRTLCLSQNPYIRRKALLCAIRVVRKVEDMAEHFLDVVSPALEEKNHGILLVVSSLICALIEAYPVASHDTLSALSPQLRARLKHITLMSGYSSAAEYDVAGTTDPFLQVKLLKTLRVLHEKDVEPDAALGESIAQVVNSTDLERLAGCSVLLECAHTILHIKHDQSLFDVSVNILGSFLQHKDCTIRYVALSCFHHLVQIDVAALQAHRSKIITFLKDPDPPIRRRAMEVIYSLINESTFLALFDELMQLLETLCQKGFTAPDDRDFCVDLASKIVTALECFSPTRRWQIDAFIRLFSCASEVLPAGTLNSFVVLISVTPEVQYYTTMKLLTAAKANFSQPLLLHAAIWTLGEYGSLFLRPPAAAPSETALMPHAVLAQDVVSFLELCAKHCHGTSALVGTGDSIGRPSGLLIGTSPLVSNQYNASSTTGTFGNNRVLVSGGISELLLNTLAKLSSRFPQQRMRIQSLLALYDKHYNVELQQRSVEYRALMQPEWDAHRSALFEQIPCVLEKVQEQPIFLEKMLARPTGDTSLTGLIQPERCTIQTTKSSKTVDLLGGLINLTDEDLSNAPPLLSNPGSAPENAFDDLLIDVFTVPTGNLDQRLSSPTPVHHSSNVSECEQSDVPSLL